ncbi:MAG: ATP-dependent 6-phosphofructokinase [Thermoplasmata archaeon]|nr:ATP-dependent 6-phosphofructokinase [Thermoplasmata archaeon]
MTVKRIGVMTGGGDAPGLNAVIRAIVHRADSLGIEVLGLRNGWAALVGDGGTMPLDLGTVQDIHVTGGTILGTSRTNPYKVDNGPGLVRKNLREFGCDALIVIGGEDTLGVADRLSREGLKVVGVPKTIDNDLSATDYTFGFDTACNRAAEAMRDLHTTARSHSRVLVVEVMGRHAGWITLNGGIAGAAHVVLLPEEPFSLDEVCEAVMARERAGHAYSIIAVSEGAVPDDREAMVLQTEERDAFGHVRLGGIGERLAKAIGERTGKESRHVVLGHLQRAGAPSAFDVVLGTRLGVKAADMVGAGEFGMMASLRGTAVVAVPLSEAVGTLKTVPEDLREESRLFWAPR